jgi:chromosome segregation ATPase
LSHSFSQTKLASTKEDLEETQGLLQQVTEQSEGGDKSSKASDEQLEWATDELRDLQGELVAVKKERDEFKALVQELEEKNASLTQDENQTEEYEDIKSQLMANKITVQQNKKLNELLQKKVERLTASEASLKKELGETQQGKESKELLEKEVERLTASEVYLKKELEEAQLKPKGGRGLATTSYEEEGREVKDELALAEQEVKRSRLRIQSLEKQVQQARKEADLLKREVERTKKRDSTDAHLAEGGDSPGPKKPRADGV